MIALRLFFFLTLITGFLYPLLVTGVSQTVFPRQANGLLISTAEGEVIGSQLIGQTFQRPEYFWGRPSATNYESAGATNLPPSNKDLMSEADSRNGVLSVPNVPIDLLTSSGSGLDPHISPQSAELQLERVAQARGLDQSVVRALIQNRTEYPTLGVLGQPRVNVLLLNLDLDKEKPSRV
jgi:K+-transporting ATPase ATPase C chain